MPRKFWDWLRPDRCEISGCENAAARRALIMGATFAWMCEEHCAQLEVGPLTRRDGRGRAREHLETAD